MKRSKSKHLILFGSAVRARREALGISQEALAGSCKLDRTYIGGIERGERNIGILNLWRIADALGLHPSELLAEESP